MAAVRAKRAAIAAGMAAALLLCAGTARADFARAESLRLEGKWREAAEEYGKVLQEQPENPQVLYGLGVSLTEVGRTEGDLDSFWLARKHLEKLATLAPGVAEYRFYNGFSASLLAPNTASFAPMLRDLALAELKEAQRLKPGYWDAQFQIARILEARGDLPAAIEAYALAIRGDPARLDPYPLLALVLFQSGRYDECLDTAAALLQKAPDYAFARKIMGDALAAKNDFGKAEAEYRLGVKAEPANSAWYDSLWILFDRAKDFDRAIAIFGELAAGNPDLETPRKYLAAALGLMKRYEEAAREYGELVKRFPQSPFYRQGLGDSFLNLGRTDEAMASFLEALRLAPQWGDPLYYLKKQFESLRFSFRFREAADLLKRVVAANPEPKVLCWVHWELAENLMQLNDVDGVFAALGKAIELDPLEPRSRNSRGLFLLTLGRNEEARAEFEAALEISPGYMYAIENLAAIHLMARRVAESGKWFEKGLACAQEQFAMAGDPEVKAEREFDIFKFNYFLHELESVEAASGGKR